MDFKNYLKENAHKMDQTLDEILLDFLEETKNTNIKLLSFAEAFIKSCEGGKRIRGVLVKLGYELAGGKSTEIFQVGVALEILHTAILVHDDVIDQSPTRRGQPTLYQALGGGHYGESQAISLGDIGLYLPLKIIAESSFKADFKLKALSHLSQTIVNTGWGQVLDIMQDKDLILLYKLKTAYYTIAGPLILGAILVGAEEKLLGYLGKFGENLGIAFQIKDDILDGESGSMAQATKYVSLAKKLIPKVTTDKKMAKILFQMAEYLVQRSK